MTTLDGPKRARTATGTPFLSVAAAFAIAATAVSCSTARRHGPAPSAVRAVPPAAGNLFSTIPSAATALGRTWARLLPEARVRFPGLALTMVEDLHVTIVYVGSGWRREDLGTIRSVALVAPREAFSSRPGITRFGTSGHVVVAEMKDAPASWRADVAAAKAEMNRLGLKRPDRYDAEFRPHVTLATARRRPPDASDAAELDALAAWLAKKAAADPSGFTVALGPGSPVRLWLAGLVRPAGAAEYVDLDGSAPPR